MGRQSSSDDEVSEEGSAAISSSEEVLKSRKRSKKSKLSSHKKKKSKDKKHKKKSKKYRRWSSSSEDASLDSGSGEEEWVVKSNPATEKRVTESSTKAAEEDVPLKKTKLEEVATSSQVSSVSKEDDDSEWLNFGNTLPTYSTEARKSERRKEREQERELRSIDKPGQSVNELNPYWKDGGSGLPGEQSTSRSETQVVGDGGLSYLRKAYIRAKEQAAEDGKSVEEIISGRWGSLEKFLSLLEEAEKKAAKFKDGTQRDEGRKRFMRPNRDSDSEDERHSHSRHSHSSSRRRYERHRDNRERRRRSRSGDRSHSHGGSSSGWRKESHPHHRSPQRRSRSPDRDNTKIPDVSSSPSVSKSKLEIHKEEPLESNCRVPDPSPSPELEEQESEKILPKVLTDKEMNELNAKLLKAEMLGNESLVEDLKAKIAEAEAARQTFIKSGGDLSQPLNRSTKVVTKVVMESSSHGGRRRKDKITETHKDGQRIRYFPDDDKQTLHNMFQKEKMNTAVEENALFARLAGKGAKTGKDYDIDDVFTDKASSSKQVSKEQEREIRDALYEEKNYKKIIDSCQWCFDGNVLEKHLILSVAEKSYLCVPPYQSVTEGHCLIVPMSHVNSGTELDEDVWDEMQKFRRALVSMFRAMDQDMVIFETALFVKRHPHMYLECIPMPKETGELAPIYFKKAIQECEAEWSQNKKLVDLRNRDVRRAVPKGLPYFSVDFGDDSCGFAHVIEDERNFPKNFAHEIIGGMMELDHHLWRKQKKDDFKTQRKKVMDFLKDWSRFDWTRDSN